MDLWTHAGGAVGSARRTRGCGRIPGFARERFHQRADPRGGWRNPGGVVRVGGIERRTETNGPLAHARSYGNQRFIRKVAQVVGNFPSTCGCISLAENRRSVLMNDD